MTEVITRRELAKLTKGLTAFPDVASSHVYKAQKRNAQEATGYMQALVPQDQGVTRANTLATAYKRESDGTIGFAMRTARPNVDTTNQKKDERIKAILFANGTDFFYGVWNLNKKRWRGRMTRAMTKSAREIAGRIS